MTKKPMLKTKIYIGLNDSESKKQEFSTEKYINVLKHVCHNYRVPFSFTLEQGGYIHEDGEYTQELSIVLSMIDVKKDLINEIAKDLCVLFHQESVMITEDHVRAYFISESL